MNKYAPYDNREEHRYVNKMTVILAKLRLALKEGEEAVNTLQKETDEHIRSFLKRKRKDDESYNSVV